MSVFSNGLDPECCKRAYYGMLGMMLKELKENFELEMPDFCKISVLKYKKDSAIHPILGVIDIKGAKRIKFSACLPLKQFIKHIDLDNLEKNEP